MHEPITEFPKGEVVASLRLAKRDQTIDVTRLIYGSRTRFVERVLTKNSKGTLFQTAFRKTDDFPSKAIADRYIGEWLHGIVENRGYKVIHEDEGFRAKED